MQIKDKLSKIGDSFSVNMYDNGFMFEASGRDSESDWASVKILCTTLDELVKLIEEASAMERE
jgi:hypothetical protein